MFTAVYIDLKKEILPANKPIRGARLSFLPLQHHYSSEDGFEGIYIELDEFVLLELKQSVTGAGQRLDLMTEHVALWQLYQFMGSSDIYLPHNLPLSDNRCISFSSQVSKIPLILRPTRQWIILIGYKKNFTSDLLKEFPMLGSLVFGADADHSTWYWEPDISINHSLREVWKRIERTIYFPFRGKAELLLHVCRLLEEYCKQLDKQSDQSERSMLGLYHKALAYINDNLLDSINKEMVAEGLNVSLRTLTRAFENRPIKIVDYIQRLKLNHARDLLYEGEMSIEAISNLLNYPNRKYFSREFKKYFFQSPSIFKKEMEFFKAQGEDDES